MHRKLTIDVLRRMHCQYVLDRKLIDDAIREHDRALEAGNLPVLTSALEISYLVDIRAELRRAAESLERILKHRDPQ